MNLFSCCCRRDKYTEIESFYVTPSPSPDQISDPINIVDRTSIIGVPPLWRPGVIYYTGQLVLFYDNVYCCLTEHYSERVWMPQHSNTLWLKITDTFNLQ